MESLIIEATSDTPNIILDQENGKFEISGKSLPEDVSAVYTPVLEWLDRYVASPNEKTKVVFKMEYYNTASSKMILELLERFKKIHTDGNEIEFEWRYIEDDDDMLEAGEEYSEILEVPFNLISIED